MALKRGAEAETLLRQIVKARQAEGGDPRDLLSARKHLAECLRSLGRLDEAVVIYREVWLAEFKDSEGNSAALMSEVPLTG